MSNQQWNSGSHEWRPSSDDAQQAPGWPQAPDPTREWERQQPQAASQEWQPQGEADTHEWRPQTTGSGDVHASQDWYTSAPGWQGQGGAQQPQAHGWQGQPPGQDWQAQQAGPAWQQGGGQWPAQQSEWAQQGWGQPPAAPQARSTAKAEASGLFDFSFRRLALPGSAGLIFTIGVAAVAAEWLFRVIGLLMSEFAPGMAVVEALVVGLAAAVFKILVLRILIEIGVALISRNKGP